MKPAFDGGVLRQRVLPPTEDVEVAQRDRHRGYGDQLAVGIDGDMALVAVKAASRRLMAVARLAVHGRDDAVLGDPARDPEHAVVALVEILADHRRQQRGGLRDRLVKLAAIRDIPRCCGWA